VFAKVTVAAETVLARSLPGLIAGTAPRRIQPIEPGHYFGRRRPEDGRIDWAWPAEQIHNLVRAVAPPFPGAFADVQGERWSVHKTRVAIRRASPGQRARLVGIEGQCHVECRDGSVLQLLAVATAAGPLNLQALACELARKPRLLA
jgi:methionyl-tRNA formyltransferase